MKYTNSYTRATPGLIIFMVDQSASMSQIGYEGRPLAETAADMVNKMISELEVRFCIGDRIKDAAHIIIIAYGSADGSMEAELLRSDSIASLFDDDTIPVQHFKQMIPDGAGGELLIEREIKQFVAPKASSAPNMTFAFELANSLINDWKEYCCEDNHRSSHTPAPIVINITKGSNNIGDDEELIKVSNQIKNIEFKDGNPLIVSVLIPTHHYFECLSLPVQKVFAENLPGWERIWWSSSNVPEELKDAFFIVGDFIDVSNESKLIFVNPDNKVKTRIIDSLITRPGASFYR